MGLRRTGINIIGDVPWGTHISQLYSSKYDFLEELVPYVKEGLFNNELCVWIYSQNMTYQEIREYLEKNSIDVEKYIDGNQLKIIPHTGWYLMDNTFDEVRVNEKWLKLLKDALDKGFDGLRVVADIGWLEKCFVRSFLDYERNINSIVSEQPFIALCLYDVRTMNVAELTEVINNHRYMLVKDDGKLKALKNVELLVKDKRLEQIKADYKRLLRFLPEAVFIHDKQKIFYCNEAAVRIVGMEDANLILGRSMIELIADSDKNSYKRFIDQILDNKESNSLTKSRLVDKNGEIKDVEVVATNYVFNGFPAVLSVIRDISPLRRLAELERDIRKNAELLKETLEYEKMKTEFFTNISHELRTPINVILSALTLINMVKQDIPKSNKERKYFKMMQQNCYRLLKLINNIIDLNKIDSEFFELNLKNCDIVKIVEDTTLSIVDYTNHKGIELQFDTTIEEKVIACDPDQIERIILNLLSNAIKFTPSGGNIWVNLVDFEDKVVVTVKDSGIGIPPNKQQIIFDRFQQVHKSFNEQCLGSGIGLSLVKSLVEKHGGKITLKSEMGRGSEFIFELPCRTIPQDQCDLHTTTSEEKKYIERAVIEFSDIYT